MESSFKIICNKCGAETLLEKVDEWHFKKSNGDISIFQAQDTLFIECLCGNEIAND